VRRTWKIALAKVSLARRSWSKSLDAIVEKVAAGLGVISTVSPEFYKLLMYDEGGELVVRHGTREVSLDLNNADCVHEVRPFLQNLRRRLMHSQHYCNDGLRQQRTSSFFRLPMPTRQPSLHLTR
jgi:hypothetical protein